MIQDIKDLVEDIYSYRVNEIGYEDEEDSILQLSKDIIKILNEDK